MTAFDEDEQRAIAVAARALARANDALDGYRVVYEAFGRFARELAAVTSANVAISEAVTQAFAMLPPPATPAMRARAPSVEDLVAETAARTAAEITASHKIPPPGTPSERVRKVVREERDHAVAAVVGKIAGIALTVVVSALVGAALSKGCH